MNIRYRVELSQSECDQLTALLSGGKHPARKLKRAQILLAADAGASDAEIAARVVVGGSTVYHTKRHFVEGNLELALAEELLFVADVTGMLVGFASCSRSGDRTSLRVEARAQQDALNQSGPDRITRRIL